MLSTGMAGHSNGKKTQEHGSATSYRMSFESLHACARWGVDRSRDLVFA